LAYGALWPHDERIKLLEICCDKRQSFSPGTMFQRQQSLHGVLPRRKAAQAVNSFGRIGDEAAGRKYSGGFIQENR
jgi:hypothetical protein